AGPTEATAADLGTALQCTAAIRAVRRGANHGIAPRLKVDRPWGVSKSDQGARALRTSNARRVAALRLSTPSFSKTLPRCFFTVFSAMLRITATSPLDLPWATQSKTSASRGVKPSDSSGLAVSKFGLKPPDDLAAAAGSASCACRRARRTWT